MIGLRRNEQTIYYSVYNGMTDMTDSSGFLTGEKTLNFADPVALKANVAPAAGTVEREVFGMGIDYDVTIVTYDITCPITEESRVWIGKDTSEPHNYIVKRIARSQNVLRIALKEVTVG